MLFSSGKMVISRMGKAIHSESRIYGRSPILSHVVSERGYSGRHRDFEAPHRFWRRGIRSQAIGRNVTGWSTKIIAMTDAPGNLVRFTLIPGQHYDMVGVSPLLAPANFGALLVDKAFDVHWIVDVLRVQGACVVIPQRRNRLDRRPFDRALFKVRHFIENFFCKLKELKRIAIPSDKTDRSFAARIYLITAVINSR
ncbi:transposase [Komagataeibacter melomenusus]